MLVPGKVSKTVFLKKKNTVSEAKNTNKVETVRWNLKKLVGGVGKCCR